MKSILMILQHKPAITNVPIKLHASISPRTNMTKTLRTKLRKEFEKYLLHDVI